jgi:hypothetical protein
VTNKTFAKAMADFLVGCFKSGSPLKTIVTAMLLLSVVGLASCHRNRAWQNIPVTQHSNPTSSTSSNTNYSACKIGEEDAAGMNGDLRTDVHAVLDYSTTVARMLKEEKFEELDCLADHSRSTEERFPGGMWKLHELYKSVSSPVPYPRHATQEDWDALLQRLQDWVTARPKSVAARIALASAYIGYAADARGDDDANTVSQSGWKLFRERTAEAKRILEESSSLPTKCPEWYVIMQQVAQNEGWSEAKTRGLYDQAIQFEPGYYYYARVLASNLLPKWGGEPGATEKFVQQAADRIGGEQGDILYFQVASANSVMCACESDPHLSLARIERGFEASEKLYGVSMLNLNRIAFLAALSRLSDELFADKAFARIGDQWDEETWTMENDFELAKTAASFLGEREALVQAADANMKTPEGLRYKVSFEKPYKELAKQCVRLSDSDVGTFMTLTRVGANGMIDDVRIASTSGVAVCLYEKLRALQQEKAMPFPRPPKPAYWVRLDLGWAELAPLAAKSAPSK